MRTLAIIWGLALLSDRSMASGPKEGPAERTEASTVVPSPSGAYNVLQNPGFESDKMHWTLAKYNGGRAVYTLDTAHALAGRTSAKVVIDHMADHYGDIQLFQAFPVQALTEYIIAFKARVQDTTSIRISLNDGEAELWSPEVLLRPGSDTYGPFRYFSESEHPFSMLAFQLGLAGQAVLLDSVFVTANGSAMVYKKQTQKPGLNINRLSPGVWHVEIPFSHQDAVPVVVTDAHGKLMVSDILSAGNTGMEIHMPVPTEEAIRNGLIFFVYMGERVLTRKVYNNVVADMPEL